MSKEIYISSTPQETRLAIVEDDALTEIYYERENEYTLAGSIYNGKVTRVLPGMQSSFVDIGLERDAFLYITDFMEEAGDSADFEGHAGGSEPRGPRSEPRPAATPREGQRESYRRDGRNGRSSRGDRNGGTEANRARTPDAAEEPLEVEPSPAAVSADPVRPVQAGNRGRTDNRDRGRNSRRDRYADSAPAKESDVPAFGGDSFAPETTTLPIAPLSVEPLDSADLGEAAPGADGSRRWRGRRGRRGGRVGSPGYVPQTSDPIEADAPGSFVDYDRLDIDASEAVPVVPIAPPVVASTAFTRPERASNERMDRGNRGQRTDRGGRESSERGSRTDRDRTPRVPRGFAPRTPYGTVPVEEEAPVYGQEQFAEAPATPVILPGESLSKYRSASEQPLSQVDAAPVVKPSVEFTLPTAWDGGLVLPGETIRRRESGQPVQRERAPESPRESFRSAPRPEAYRIQPNLNTTLVPPPPMPEKAVALAPAEPAPIQQTASSASEVTLPEVTLPGGESADRAVPEYEPTEASVSFRVDPIPPSKFVQPAFAVDEPETTPADPYEYGVDIPAASAAEVASDPESPLTLAPGHQQGFGSGSTSAPPELAHDVTSIFASGDMHSEPPVEALDLDPISGKDSVPVEDPVSDEVDEVHVAGSAIADGSTTLQQQQQDEPEQVQHFAPGTGFLEEEVLEDEEEIPTLQGSAVEMEDREETETLEGAADLGTMIREMSIDQITRPAPSLVSEDEDEEDFLEEDQDYSLEEDDEEDSEGLAASDMEEREIDGRETEEHVTEHVTGDASSNGQIHANPMDVNRGSREPESVRPRSREDAGREKRGSRAGGFSNNREGSDRPRRDSRSGGRQSMQATNLPAISDLLKPGQELLCQIAKEPMARKGARITSHIALPGRFLVFMPTVSHTGVSRKIESDAERRRLREILLSEKGEAAGGFIVRTAAANATEEELRSDLRFLLNLWADIKTRSEGSKSPALIYHDLNLVERVLRDQVTDNFSAIWVDSETEYERVLRFLQRFQPSLIRRVKLYTKETPLFEQFGINEEINKALRSKVWLKSGGSIVINQTEALVAIDINTGKFVGKTARLEDTIVKTNLDAIPEIVRQIRLRDLGGIIIIDFIDMDERRNRNKVMAALEEELKLDRAPSKVLQFNDFGLVAITRKRVKQSLERTLSTTCGICAGTGMVKSPVSVCNDIYIEMRKMHKHLDRGDVMLRVNPEVVKQLKAPGTKWLQEMEEMVGKTILVKSDPALHPEQFDIH